MNGNSQPQPDDLTPVMVFPMLNFPIKIMGVNQPEFPTVICELAAGHFSDFDKGTMTTAAFQNRQVSCAQHHGQCAVSGTARQLLPSLDFAPDGQGGALMLNTEAVKPGSVKAWMAFTRPKTWGVAVAPVIAALSLALFETGRFDGLTAFFTMTIALLMQIISNMKNDLGYTEKKAETGNRRGLPRATSQGWISVSTARRAILALIMLALLNTAVLIWLGGWVFALIGIASVVAAYSYMAARNPLPTRRSVN